MAFISIYMRKSLYCNITRTNYSVQLGTRSASKTLLMIMDNPPVIPIDIKLKRDRGIPCAPSRGRTPLTEIHLA